MQCPPAAVPRLGGWESLVMREPHSRTLVEALEGAESTRAELIFHLRDGTQHLPAEQLLEQARRGAVALAGWGVEPGDTVGILGPNRPEWARWAFATWAAGAAVVPLPYHLRVPDPEAFAQRVGSLIQAAGCKVVLAHPRFFPYFPPGLGVSWDADLPRSTAPAGREPRPEDRAVIQFTSGSTASPKGVVLTHSAVLAGIRNSFMGAGSNPDHVYLSWLPFFHDWGLFGYLVWSIVMATETHILPTERFAKDPSEWLRLAGRVRATATPGPTSAWDAALRVASRRPDGIDLSSLLVCSLAAEAIEPRVVDRMLDVGASLGLRPDALSGAYGMAETTLGITVTSEGSGVRIDSVDRERLAGTGAAVPAAGAEAKRVVACGPPVPGTEIRIMGEEGELPERRVGEIQVRGPSLMEGYLGDAGPDPFIDGWLRTGDLGYMSDGELYVTGRSKDVIIVMGRNYAPQDIEWAAERVEGIRVGRCVAFGREAVEGEVVVAAEAKGDDVDGLPERVWQAVSDAVGIVPREVIVLPRGTVPMTTSGKLRRSWVREAYAAGDLSGIALAVGSEVEPA